MRKEMYQIFLIFLGIAATLLLAGFFYREIFPEYLIYQDDYIALEKFRSSYTHEPPPTFKRGVKQILIEREDKGNPTIDRCISCHVALQFSHFSPTKIKKDLNGNIVYDKFGVPVKVPNEDYIWKKLEDKIAELREPAILEQLKKEGNQAEIEYRLNQAKQFEGLKKAQVGDYVYDVTKVLAMHPLIGKETRPFEFHPMDNYGCVSCHNGNGRGLATDRAHGPLFDEQYETEYQGEFPKFLEQDPLNDPLFSKMFNSKPGARLIFQTKPILVGALVQAKCIQCHQSSGALLESAATSALWVTSKKQKEIQNLEDSFKKDKEAFLSMLSLQEAIKEKGYNTLLEQLQAKEKDYTLSLAESEKIAGQIKFLETLTPQSAISSLNSQLIDYLGSSSLLDQFKEGLKKEKSLDQLLKEHQNDPQAKGLLFIKFTTLNLEKNLSRHVLDVENSFSQSVKDQTAFSQMATDIDRLTADYRNGQHLFLSQGCYACHRIAGFSRGGVGPELTKSGETYPWFLKQKMVWPQADLKTSTMPEMRLDHEELEGLMTFLLGQEGANAALSQTAYKNTIQAWENGQKLPWEQPATPVQIHDVRYGMHIFAEEGCASCHRLKGYESDVGFKIEKENPTFDALYKEKKWFSNLFPEFIFGSQIVEVLEKHAEEIDAKIASDVRKGSILEEIEKKSPGLIESFYSDFKYAMRAKNHAYAAMGDMQKLQEWKERVRKVLLLFVQEYGLGRVICPRPNWSGIYRSDEWLMEHFHSPTSHTPRSIMPVFPFDDSKFYALTYMLDMLAKKNRDAVREIWKHYGFNPEQAFAIHCSQCHGDYLQGNGPVATWIYPIPKNLRRADFLRNLTKERAMDSIHHGVKGTPMPPWGEAAMDKPMADGIPVLSEKEIKILVDWIFSSLPGGTVIQTEEDVPKWQYTPKDVMEELKKEKNKLQGKIYEDENAFIAALSPVFADTEIFNVVDAPKGAPDKYYYYIKRRYYTSANLDAGRAFFELNCAVCHGKEADGSGVRAEAMHDAKPRMLTNLDWINTRDDMRLLRSIKYGVPGTAMTPWGDLTSSLQRLQLVMYIRSLTESQEVRNQLMSALYQSYDASIAKIEASRVKEYEKLQEAEQRYKKALTSRKELDDEVRQGKLEPAKALQSYEEELLAEKEVEKRKEIDNSYQKLIQSIQDEEELYKSVGQNLMIQKADPSLMNNLIKVIQLNKDPLQDNQGKEKEISKILNEMIKQIDQKIKELTLEKIQIEGKIMTPDIQTELNSQKAAIASWAKLKELVFRNFEEAASLRKEQKGLLILLQNSIYSPKLTFLPSLLPNFSTICKHMLSKFGNKEAQKPSIFSSKANFARGLVT